MTRLDQTLRINVEMEKERRMNGVHPEDNCVI